MTTGVWKYCTRAQKQGVDCSGFPCIKCHKLSGIVHGTFLLNTVILVRWLLLCVARIQQTREQCERNIIVNKERRSHKFSEELRNSSYTTLESNKRAGRCHARSGKYCHVVRGMF
jgi:hypothetical protein